MSGYRPLVAVVVACLLMSSCGDDGGGPSADDASREPGLGNAAQGAGSTLVPEPSTIWVGSSEASALLKVDTATRSVEQIKVNEGPWQVEYVDGSVWVRTPQVQRINPDTGEPGDVLPEDVQVYDFLVDGDGIWVSLRDEPKLVRYDLATGTAGQEVELPSEDLTLENMTLSDGFMLAENSYDGTAVRIDLETGEVVARYNPDAVIWDLQLLGDSLWVAHYDGLVELDAETLKPREVVQDVDAAYALDADETGRLWVGLDDSIGTMNDSGQLERVGNNVSDGSGGGSVDDLKVSEKSVWIAHADVGLVRMDRATSQLDEPIRLPGAGAFAPGFEVALQ